MIELVPMDSDNIVGFKISGKVQGGDLDRVADAIEEKLKTHAKVRVYAEVLSIEGMAIQSVLKDLQLAVKHFSNIDKEAICSDKGWLKTLAGIGDRLFSSIEVKHFSLEDKQQAVQWLQS